MCLLSKIRPDTLLQVPRCHYSWPNIGLGSRAGTSKPLIWCHYFSMQAITQRGTEELDSSVSLSSSLYDHQRGQREGVVSCDGGRAALSQDSIRSPTPLRQTCIEEGRENLTREISQFLSLPVWSFVCVWLPVFSRHEVYKSHAFPVLLPKGPIFDFEIRSMQIIQPWLVLA